MILLVSLYALVAAEVYPPTADSSGCAFRQFARQIVSEAGYVPLACFRRGLGGQDELAFLHRHSSCELASRCA